MKKIPSLRKADVGVLLGSWTTYSVAFGCPHEATIVVFDTISRLARKENKLVKAIALACWNERNVLLRIL